ncbi:MAG: adenylate/guanylate cyclase domain-containing protein [Planctomycetota bacterium]|jgi:adenylate cyclase|nr:adenylate/guanylate cyclase domain-containing protein [Planctomycetota bacterium]
MDRTTRRVKSTVVHAKPIFRLPDHKALGPVVVGVCFTIFAALVNHFVANHRAPTLYAVPELHAESAENPRRQSLYQQWANSFSAVVRSSDDRIFTVLHSLFAGPPIPAATPKGCEVVVITIDEASLQRVGLWPWSRRHLGRILTNLKDAKVVGLDLILHDADSTSLDNFLSTFSAIYGVDPGRPVFEVDAEFMNNDLFLARRIAETRTVSGMHLVGDRFPGGSQKLPNDYTVTARLPDGRAVDPDRALLRRARGIVANMNLLRVFDPGMSVEGFINLFPDVDGAVKAAPLFIRKADEDGETPGAGIVAALPLEMLRLGKGGTSYALRLNGGETTVDEFAVGGDDGKRYFIEGVSLLDGGGRELLDIPLNELGEMMLAGDDRDRTFTVIPAWEVLYGRHKGLFKDKYVICDLTVAGTGGVRAPSLANDPQPDVFIHAAMLASMLAGDFRRYNMRSDHLWQQALTIAAGLLVSLGLLYGGPLAGGLMTLACLFGLTALNYLLLFRSGVTAGPAVPILNALAVLGSQSSVGYLVLGRERRFIRTAFSLNVSPTILTYLETHPDRLSSLGGEQRDMTVLFSDIRGFTAISESMTAPDLARFLNEYLTPMSDIVMQNLGTVDKFMGDALMAFWNAPTNDPEHAGNAGRAALQMLDKLDEIQEGWSARGLPRLAIGCGINTGPMFAGYMGSEQRKNYTVMGDNVNIASRLEGLNKIYASNIIISESTKQDLGGDFYCCVLDKVRVSGRREPVLIYELLGEGVPDEGRVEETATFERVFQLYQQREFAAAESLLKELVFIRPHPLYDMYLDRLAVYLALPPPPSWDGTFSVNSK